MLRKQRLKKIRNRILSFIIITSVLVLVAVWNYQYLIKPISKASEIKSTSQASTTVQMIDQDESGQNGTTTITDDGNNESKVVIDIEGEPTATSEPVTIDTGSCSLVGGVAYTLNNLIGGSSTTTIDVPFSEMLYQQLPLAINVEDTSAQPDTYATCGDVSALK